MRSAALGIADTCNSRPVLHCFFQRLGVQPACSPLFPVSIKGACSACRKLDRDMETDGAALSEKGPFVRCTSRQGRTPDGRPDSHRGFLDVTQAPSASNCSRRDKINL